LTQAAFVGRIIFNGGIPVYYFAHIES